MTVSELIEALHAFPGDLDVVARFPHCCGRHWMGPHDVIAIRGAKEDAWWSTEPVAVTIKRFIPDGKGEGDFSEPYTAVGFEPVTVEFEDFVEHRFVEAKSITEDD